MLYWHIPMNEDRSSVLQRFLPPDVPAEDIFASDLAPARETWGQAEDDPCIFLRYSPRDGLEPLPGKLVRSCSDEDFPKADEAEETFELSLRYGVLLDRHTDFYLPDTAPIEFERVTREGWRGAMGFGISGTHTYDKYLRSPNDMVTIQVIQPEGNWQSLKRTPRWLPVLAMVKYVDADYSGALYEMRWHATPFENFSLTRYDGATETYLPCDDKTLCYETGQRDREGHELAFQRDTQRRLTKLTSPAGQWISLRYGPADHITAITDSRGRTVKYGYDDRNRLVTVTYPSGAIYSYTYDNTQHLLTFSVAADSSSAPQLILRNSYRDGRLVKQELAGGRVYQYVYAPPESDVDGIDSALVSASDGTVFGVRFTGDLSTIWELASTSSPDTQPSPN
jgi:YD repeat-containing protein